MKKILIGTVGILLYKYLPRSITFMPLGVSKAILCIAMIVGYFLLDESLRDLIKHKFSYIKFCKKKETDSVYFQSLLSLFIIFSLYF